MRRGPRRPAHAAFDPAILKEGPLPTDTVVSAGAATTAYVDYKKPVSGGSQAGTMRIETNDIAWGPRAYDQIRARCCRTV